MKCLQTKSRDEQSDCVIRFDVKPKCSQCRLKKCFDLGMRKDFLMSFKEKRIEENPSINDLTENEKKNLKEIEQNYRTVWHTSPSPASVFSFEKVPDLQSAFIHSMNIDNLFAIRLIHFLRSIKEFNSLDERDRLTLVKYNLSLTACIESLIAFNINDDLSHFETPISNGLANEDAFIQYSMQLYTTCYGEETIREYVSLGYSLSEAVGKDGQLVLVLILMMIFLKGWSIYDDQASVLSMPNKFLLHNRNTPICSFDH